MPEVFVIEPVLLISSASVLGTVHVPPDTIAVSITSVVGVDPIAVMAALNEAYRAALSLLEVVTNPGVCI